MPVSKRATDLAPRDVIYFATRSNKVVAEVKEGSVRSKRTNRPYSVIWVRWAGEDDFTWKIGRSSWVSVVTDTRCDDCSIPIPTGDRFCGPCATMQDWSEGI